jgi:hypothetical protein
MPASAKVDAKKVLLFSQLDAKDKNADYRKINTLLTKNKFEMFIDQNIQTR